MSDCGHRDGGGEVRRRIAACYVAGMRKRTLLACLPLLFAAACPGGTPPLDDGSDTDAGTRDAGAPDAGASDGGVDGGVIDGGVVDGGAPDAGPPRDGGEGGFDGGVDAGLPPLDGGALDAGPVDDGGGPPSDAGAPSAAAVAYWESTGQGLSGQALVDALHAKLASTHVKVPYSDLHDAYQSTDSGRGGCEGIFDFYSTRCWSSSDACGNYDEEGDCYNREHSWPKSWWGGGESFDAYSDLFHVIPADGYVNNLRGNHPLGEVASPTIHTSTNGSLVGECANPEAGGTCFEPADALKGDLARIYFYMAARYEGELGCCQRAAVDGANLEPWTEVVLRAWHEADPVDDDERARNEAVYLLQGNRNPFVDFPSWVSRVADF